VPLTLIHATGLLRSFDNRKSGTLIHAFFFGRPTGGTFCHAVLLNHAARKIRQEQAPGASTLAGDWHWPQLNVSFFNERARKGQCDQLCSLFSVGTVNHKYDLCDQLYLFTILFRYDELLLSL
jgi:hypothetical protein